MTIAGNAPKTSVDRRLVVGLVNNMPDGAVRRTEDQYRTLLRAATPRGVELTLRFFRLKGVARGPDARAYMDYRYEAIEDVSERGVDALIVTGAEPHSASLEAEPYWPSLAQLIDRTEADHLPVVWSCLAAHAAVLRLRGVRRRSLPSKHSGVFELVRAREHPLLAAAPPHLAAPHSRLNDLNALELERAGYELLTTSPVAGVDAFVTPERPLALFLQGHPEYDQTALAREYLRDVARFLRGSHPRLPDPPIGYFDEDTLSSIEDLSRLAAREQAEGLEADFVRVVKEASPIPVWRPWAVHLYRTWLDGICSRAACRSSIESLPAAAASPRHDSPVRRLRFD